MTARSANQVANQTKGHTPVLLREVIAALNPAAGAVIVDGTFGGGGYSSALLEAAPCVIWGIDRDADAIKRGADLSARYDRRLNLLHGRYGNMRDLLATRGIDAVDGVVLDLGISSWQLNDPARGFSFRAENDGPLDMRMERTGETAAELVNSASETVLADIIYAFGEERAARRIARAIVAARADKPIETTGALADIVRAALPRQAAPTARTDPATRTYQALRIHVNDELDELDRGLVAAEDLLKPGGRLAVVSFHSLEDRRVKSFLRARSGETKGTSRHLPPAASEPRAATFTLLSRRATKPSQQEIASNPRARSARLRAAERLSTPAWSSVDGDVAQADQGAS